MAHQLIIFDLGGVLIERHPERLIEQVVKASGRSRQEVEAVANDPKLVEQFELGRMTPSEVFADVKRRLGLPWDFDQFAQAWNGILSYNPQLTSLLERLRSHYTLAVLSNTNALHDAHIRRSWPVFERIHHWVASWEVGFRKPEPQIYELVLERANVRPQAAVYIDDVKEFVDAGRRVGLTGIHLADGLVLEHELRAVGLHV